MHVLTSEEIALYKKLVQILQFNFLYLCFIVTDIS